jgi:hypothetical protein
MLASLEERTGKNMAQWLAALKKAKASTPAECRAFLKTQGLGASSIGLIIDQIAGKCPDTYDPHALVAALFQGPKAALFPLYETVLAFTLDLGADIKACPCATFVPFYRKHVFAQLKPSTKTRLDLGLALGDAKVRGLIETGGFAKKDRITHRLELSAPADFNDFAKECLTQAYTADS